MSLNLLRDVATIVGLFVATPVALALFARSVRRGLLSVGSALTAVRSLVTIMGEVRDLTKQLRNLAEELRGGLHNLGSRVELVEGGLATVEKLVMAHVHDEHPPSPRAARRRTTDKRTR